MLLLLSLGRSRAVEKLVPNEMWQSDVTFFELRDGTKGRDLELLRRLLEGVRREQGARAPTTLRRAARSSPSIRP